MSDHEWFELRRQSDDLIYLFRRIERPEGAAYLRQDEEHWIVRRPGLGWMAWDEASRSCTGRPWETPPGEQGDHPPEGVWVSRKGAKANVYELAYVDAPGG